MLRDISFDLETLGTKPNSYIASIGAVKFDLATGEIGDTFIAKINLKKEQKGREVDPSTLVWWLQQSDEARMALLPNGDKVYSLFDALKEMFKCMEGGEYTVWGNGATFDISLLESAFHTIGNPDRIPWKFWNIRDLRTIVDVSNRMVQFDKRAMMRSGVHHSALDDAIHQAHIAHNAYKKMNDSIVTAKKALKLKDITLKEYSSQIESLNAQIASLTLKKG